MKPLRVCMVSHAAGLYGAEGAMLELICALRPHGIECHVLVPRDGPLVPALRELRIPHEKVAYRWWVDKHPTSARRVLKTAWNLASVAPVARAARKMRADLVYTNSVSVLSGALAARLLGLPHIWHLHEFVQRLYALQFDMGRSVSYRLLDRLSTRVIANSRAVAAWYAPHLSPGKLAVIYQSVSLRSAHEGAALEPGEGVFRCAVVGYLMPEKGQLQALDATALLVGRGVPIELWVLGSGASDYEMHLRHRARTLGIDLVVRFTGFVEDPQAYLRAMNAVLVCSRLEGFGRVAVEAMLVGKPVVGSRGGGTEELVRDWENGFLYRNGDPSDLADKVEYLYGHPEEAARMGRQGRNWAANRFGTERYGAEVVAVIREAVANRT